MNNYNLLVQQDPYVIDGLDNNASTSDKMEALQAEITECLTGKAEAQEQLTGESEATDGSMDSSSMDMASELQSQLDIEQNALASYSVGVSDAASSVLEASSTVSAAAGVLDGIPQMIPAENGESGAMQPNPEYYAALNAYQQAQAELIQAQAELENAQTQLNEANQTVQELVDEIASIQEEQEEDESEEASELQDVIENFNNQIESLQAQMAEIKQQATEAQQQAQNQETAKNLPENYDFSSENGSISYSIYNEDGSIKKQEKREIKTSTTTINEDGSITRYNPDGTVSVVSTEYGEDGESVITNKTYVAKDDNKETEEEAEEEPTTTTLGSFGVNSVWKYVESEIGADDQAAVAKRVEEIQKLNPDMDFNNMTLEDEFLIPSLKKTPQDNSETITLASSGVNSVWKYVESEIGADDQAAVAKRVEEIQKLNPDMDFNNITSEDKIVISINTKEEVQDSTVEYEVSTEEVISTVKNEDEELQQQEEIDEDEETQDTEELQEKTEEPLEQLLSLLDIPSVEEVGEEILSTGKEILGKIVESYGSNAGDIGSNFPFINTILDMSSQEIADLAQNAGIDENSLSNVINSLNSGNCENLADSITQIAQNFDSATILNNKYTISEMLGIETEELADLCQSAAIVLQTGTSASSFIVETLGIKESDIANEFETALGNIDLNSLISELNKTAEAIYNDSKDGTISEAKQGGIGDCYLLSAINAISSCENGREIIKNALEYQDGYTVVHLAAGDYVVCDEELEERDYSTGDNDMEIFELAIEKLYQDVANGKLEVDLSYMTDCNALQTRQENGESLIENHSVSEVMYFLTGIKPHTTKGIDNIEAIKEELSGYVGDKTKALSSYRYKTVDLENITIIEEGSVTVGTAHFPGGHAYSIKNVTDDTITVVNPWNNAVEYVMDIETFAREFHHLTVCDLNQEQDLSLVQRNDVENVKEKTGKVV